MKQLVNEQQEISKINVQESLDSSDNHVFVGVFQGERGYGVGMLVHLPDSEQWGFINLHSSEMEVGSWYAIASTKNKVIRNIMDMGNEFSVFQFDCKSEALTFAATSVAGFGS